MLRRSIGICDTCQDSHHRFFALMLLPQAAPSENVDVNRTLAKIKGLVMMLLFHEAGSDMQVWS